MYQCITHLKIISIKLNLIENWFAKATQYLVYFENDNVHILSAVYISQML